MFVSKNILLIPFAPSVDFLAIKSPAFFGLASALFGKLEKGVGCRFAFELFDALF